MGNSADFGITRDKKRKKKIVIEKNLDLSVYVSKTQKHFIDESTDDFISKNEGLKSFYSLSEKDIVEQKFIEIERYCEDIKHSKGWETVLFDDLITECIRVIFI